MKHKNIKVSTFTLRSEKFKGVGSADSVLVLMTRNWETSGGLHLSWTRKPEGNLVMSDMSVF